MGIKIATVYLNYDHIFMSFFVIYNNSSMFVLFCCFLLLLFCFVFIFNGQEVEPSGYLHNVYWLLKLRNGIIIIISIQNDFVFHV